MYMHNSQPTTLRRKQVTYSIVFKFLRSTAAGLSDQGGFSDTAIKSKLVTFIMVTTIINYNLFVVHIVLLDKFKIGTLQSELHSEKL